MANLNPQDEMIWMKSRSRKTVLMFMDQAYVQDELYNLNAYYYVIKVNGKIVGYVGFWKIIDEAHITNVAIHSDYRRSGYGRALINALLNKARELGIIAATLEVRVSNLAAISLYESFGFP